MSRFADPRRTATLALPGGCQCPGSPHEADEWTYRTELGGSEYARAVAQARRGEDIDEAVFQDALVEAASVSWNLVDDAGPVPLTLASIKLLDVETRTTIISTLDDALSMTVAPPPNASAARSRNGSRASGYRTRTAKTGG
jgi:hypothetical protein